MKYFTFIGTGSFNQTSNKEGYEVISYHFNDDEMLVKSKFIQEAIVERFKKQLEAVYVFATDDAYAKHGEELKNHLRGVKVSFINIDKNINFEEFSTALLSNIYANDQIIIDVTHSFRYLPMKLLFALDYIENAKDVEIKHLYYGRMEGDNGYIEDIAKDYQMRKISDLLSQFNRTLIINAEDIKPYLLDDGLISKFLTSLAQLNNVTELSQFKGCFNIIDSVLRLCDEILEQPKRYQLLIPFVEKIKQKLEIVNNKNNTYGRIAFIKLLLSHRRYQVAVTFTDQLFRLEVNRFNYKNKVSEADTYNYSQYVLALAGIRGKVNEKDKKLIKQTPVNIKEFKSLLSEKDVKGIKHFFGDLRNSINHGGKSSLTTKQMEEACLKVIAVIEKLEDNLNMVGK